MEMKGEEVLCWKVSRFSSCALFPSGAANVAVRPARKINLIRRIIVYIMWIIRDCSLSEEKFRGQRRTETRIDGDAKAVFLLLPFENRDPVEFSVLHESRPCLSNLIMHEATTTVGCRQEVVFGASRDSRSRFCFKWIIYILIISLKQQGRLIFYGVRIFV
jgi:hypothetical protein